MLTPPYLLFLGDASDPLAAKVARGIKDWRPEFALGQHRFPECEVDLDLEDLSIEQAAARGAKTLVVGVANRGGVISDGWIASLKSALENGMDVAAGLHNRLNDVPELVEAARANGRQLFDVRHPSGTFEVGSGEKRSGKRVLAVGTDCSCGKMYTALALEREMRAQGMKSSFRATGQTGIFIAGDGVSIDAVVADFLSGAVESLSPANDPDHWDIVEGQGSMFHASFAGVTAGLIHGAQPDALVVCHEPTRTHMRGLPHFALPKIEDVMWMTRAMARLTNPDCEIVGFAVNTAKMSDEGAEAYLAELSQTYELPAVDPVRVGVAPIVEKLRQMT